MKYNDKKKNNIEMDNMNIKSHLNTSLDLSRISVSEDLINRTIQAIKQQQEEQKQAELQENNVVPEANHKVIPWNRYLRRIVGVAVAIVIVAVGYSAISNMNMNFSSKEDAAEQLTSEYGKSSDLDMQNASTKSTELATDEASVENKTAVDTTSEESVEDTAIQAPLSTMAADAVPSVDDGAGTNGSEREVGAAEITTATDPNETTKHGDQSTLLAFRDIILPTPEQAEYIKITDVMNGTSITLTSLEEISDFYTTMDTQQFSTGTEVAKEQYYIVEVKSAEPEGAIYILTVGDNITEDYKAGDIVSQSNYSAVDNVLLNQKLGDIIIKYSK